MKVLFVGYRDKNHSSAGGYDRIINFPNSEHIMGEKLPFGFIPVGKRGKFLNLFFLNQCARCNLNKYDIVHFFYGEMIKTYTKHRKCKLVATIHMRVSDNSHKILAKMMNFDGIIALSSAQANFLCKKGINAVFIPHGFECPSFYYQRSMIDDKKINLVISGNNYRDVKTMRTAIIYCKKNRPDIHFHLVGQKLNTKEEFAEFSNVTIYPRISDDAYFSLMSDADYSFLPLNFATANNTLLEAQFLGLKSILPLIDGITDYAAPSPLNYYYDNVEELYKILSVLEKSHKCDDLVRFADKFRWENIYSQLELFYCSL